MATTARRITKDLVASRGWVPGTDLEDWAALRLSRLYTPESVRQQYRIGAYRIDFAWPSLRVALELDGWHHRSPEGAAKDAARDCELRAAGWLIFRVDDRGDEDQRADQLSRVIEVVNALHARGTPQARYTPDR